MENQQAACLELLVAFSGVNWGKQTKQVYIEVVMLAVMKGEAQVFALLRETSETSYTRAVSRRLQGRASITQAEGVMSEIEGQMRGVLQTVNG